MTTINVQCVVDGDKFYGVDNNCNLVMIILSNW